MEIISLGGCNDFEFFEDCCSAWKSILAQKMPLVCYKEGSDEIVGISWVFVTHTDDQFVEKVSENVSDL